MFYNILSNVRVWEKGTSSLPDWFLFHIASIQSARKSCQGAQRTSPWGSARCPSPGTSSRPRAARRAPCSACPAPSQFGLRRIPPRSLKSFGSPSTSCLLGAASWHVASSSAAFTSLATAGKSPTSWDQPYCPLDWWFLWWAWSWFLLPKRTGSGRKWRSPWVITGLRCLTCEGCDVFQHNYVWM